MKTLVIASNNNGKISEIKSKLAEGIRVLTMAEIGFSEDIEETGVTYEENALIKVEAIHNYCKEYGVDVEFVLAEDSGFEVAGLPEILGVYTARFMKGALDSIKNKEIIHRLNNLGAMDISQRTCNYTAVMVLKSIKTEDIFSKKGKVEGFVGFEPLGEEGFAYDPIFYLGNGVTMATLTKEEKNSISHRGQALDQIIQVVKENI